RGHPGDPRERPRVRDPRQRVLDRQPVHERGELRPVPAHEGRGPAGRVLEPRPDRRPGERRRALLNGERVVRYELHSDDWQRRVRASHAKGWKGYGMAARGHIGLQDYNDLLWFRNIKVRPLGRE